VTYQYKGTVHRIVDGDTLDVWIDLGFHISVHQRLRLFGIDTPERGEPGWKEAGNYLKELLPEGSSILVETEKGDKYGRWIATVINAEGEDVNKSMIESGLAKYY
jgi:micrococcal nuclease